MDSEFGDDECGKRHSSPNLHVPRANHLHGGGSFTECRPLLRDRRTTACAVDCLEQGGDWGFAGGGCCCCCDCCCNCCCPDAPATAAAMNACPILKAAAAPTENPAWTAAAIAASVSDP